MNGSLPRFVIVGTPSAGDGPMGFARGVAKRLQPRIVFLAFLLLLAAHVTFRIGRLLYVSDLREMFQGTTWKATLLMQTSFVACLVLSVLVADEAVGRGAPRWPTYLGALLVGAAVAAVAQATLNAWLGWDEYGGAAPPSAVTARPYQVFFGALLYGVFGCFVYVNHRTARLAGDRMRAAELARAVSRRRTLESRLQAMQARVEPQFLFNTLAQVGELYEREPATAGQMLDDLIAYLRAALPHLRESSSTLGRELELARAYLDIMRVRLGDRLAFEIDVPEEARSARMPPMMLLPLIDHAIVYGLQSAEVAGSLCIQTTAEAGRLRLQVTDTGAGFVPGTGDDGLTSIRERLDALYGSDAHFELERILERGTRATLDIPYEAADLRDR